MTSTPAVAPESEIAAEIAVPAVLAGAGFVSVAVAVLFERRMHRHRQLGVSYRDATLRKDGGWRRADLFTAEGLALQRRAAHFGWLGAVLWLLALGTWVGFRLTG